MVDMSQLSALIMCSEQTRPQAVGCSDLLASMYSKTNTACHIMCSVVCPASQLPQQCLEVSGWVFQGLRVLAVLMQQICPQIGRKVVPCRSLPASIYRYTLCIFRFLLLLPVFVQQSSDINRGPPNENMGSLFYLTTLGCKDLMACQSQCSLLSWLDHTQRSSSMKWHTIVIR